MSLLLEARKKSHPAQQEGRPSPAPEPSQPASMHPARHAGHNLFAAKSLPLVSTLPSRKLLYALGGTILLFTAGAAYLWHLNSASNTAPLRPLSTPPVPPIRQTPPIAATEPAQPTAPVTQASTAGTPQKPKPATVIPQPHSRAPLRPHDHSVRIEPQKTEPVDPLLGSAYLAYRNGRLDQAQQSYLAMLRKDAQNPDVLLGLAAITQQRGETQAAAQYYGRVLELDPRNALANAGMSAIGTDDDYSESRLKTLLREQDNSAALHFALGNLYAGQSRWSEAQQAYFSAYTLESGSAEFAFNLAVSLDHLGQKKPAAQYYQRAMQLDSSRSAGFDHAQILRRVQDLER